MEEVLNYIGKLFNKNDIFSLEDIILKCKLIGIKDETLICNALEELKVKGLIYEDDNRMHSLFPKDLYIARIDIDESKNVRAFIGNNSIIISNDHLNDALDGDIVTIKRIGNNYIVDSIVKRKDGLITVIVNHDKKDIILKPKDYILKHEIVINSMSLKSFVDGDLLLVKIPEHLENNCYYGGYVKYIGHVNDPNDDLELIAKENSINIDFSEQAINEALSLPTEVSDEDMINRLDLTDELIFSIDGKHTKDRDDAISLHLDKDGNYILGVHIADVSHYIHPGMKLWDEAMERSTSVYLANSVIPMLPHNISNGICSLNPNERRLTFSCIAKISPKGQIMDYKFVDTVIESKIALTYDEALNIIEGRNKYCDHELTLTLRLMNQLSNILENAKNKRGVIDFGNNDLVVEFDEEDNPVDLRLRLRNKAEKLIANFMQVASQCAACYVSSPAPFRVHDKPDFEDMQYALDTLSHTGIRVTAVDDIVNPKTIQRILRQIKNEPSRDIAANIILKAMKPARYSPFNIGHYALGLDKYTQFTSPIRRASDLMMHVVMKNENTLASEEIHSFSFNDMNSFCIHATNKEAQAVNAQREAILYETKKYVEEHSEDKFEAVVTFISSSGIYIKTSQGIEGKIYVEDIEGENFAYDHKKNIYRSKSGYVINIGTKLVLTPLDAQREHKTINFSIKDEDLLVLKKRN